MLSPHRQVQRLRDLAEGLVLIAVLHLEDPDFGDAGGGERLGDVISAGGGEADELPRLAGPREIHLVALELAFHASHLGMAAGEDVATECGDGGGRVGREDLRAFDAEQGAVGGVVIFVGLDARGEAAEECEKARFEQCGRGRRAGQRGHGGQHRPAGQRPGGVLRGAGHGVAALGEALRPVAGGAEDVLNQPQTSRAWVTRFSSAATMPYFVARAPPLALMFVSKARSMAPMPSTVVGM